MRFPTTRFSLLAGGGGGGGLQAWNPMRLLHQGNSRAWLPAHSEPRPASNLLTQ